MAKHLSKAHRSLSTNDIQTVQDHFRKKSSGGSGKEDDDEEDDDEEDVEPPPTKKAKKGKHGYGKYVKVCCLCKKQLTNIYAHFESQHKKERDSPEYQKMINDVSILFFYITF